MTKRLRLIAGVSAMTLVMAACGSSHKASSASSGGGATSYPPIPAGPITFGVSVPLTGATAAYGLAAQISFDKVTLPAFQAEFPNGIDGHPIQIKLLDDASDVTKAVSVAQQLSADKVAAVLTVSYNPEAAGQQLAVFNKNKVPVISTISGAKYADTKAWPYDFGIGGSFQQEGQAAATFVAAKGYTRVATISDGVDQDVEALNAITSAIKAKSPSTSVVKAITVSPGAVDLTAQVAELKAANPQLLIVYLGFGYGPLWSAMQAASFTPQVMASAGAWYDGFTGMGKLAATAVAPYYDCADSTSTSFDPSVVSLMGQYEGATADAAVNYLTFVATDTVPLLMLKYAIEKYHSISPDAIKAGMESIQDMSFDGLEYNYSADNHFGATGQFGPAICNMSAPYAGGKAKVPVKASA